MKERSSSTRSEAEDYLPLKGRRIMFGISDDLREEVKKRVYLTSNVDEFNCSSGPLTGDSRSSLAVVTNMLA